MGCMYFREELDILGLGWYQNQLGEVVTRRR